MTENSSFVFELKNSENLAEIMIKLSGRMERGLEDTKDMIEAKDFFSKITKHAKTKLVLIDLTDLIFWDTMGINETILAIKKVKESKRAGIIAKKESFIFDMAQIKYGDTMDEIPWCENYKLLIEALVQ